MLKPSFFAIFLLSLVMFTVHTASAAAEIHECGKPQPAELKTEAEPYCNIYGRQLAYGEEDKKFRDLLLERQKNFGEPGNQAAAQYREDVRALYGFPKQDSAKSDNKGPDSDDTGEAYGPTVNQ
jgi:hypothetical protein